MNRDDRVGDEGGADNAGGTHTTDADPRLRPSVDTITALATARGRAALAIVRISGPRAIEMASRCFRGTDLNKLETHHAVFGHIAGFADGVHVDRGRVGDVDQVVATVFRAPTSATGEHLVEFSCHGGDVASQLVLARVLQSGARLAEPGEFTQRAFLNGKLDLAQAEAVADLIHASSGLAHRVSLSQLQGRYSEKLQRLREDLLELAAFVELELDFSEEDVEFADRTRLERTLANAEQLLDRLLASFQVGRRIRDGISVVIAGRPNAGKSTLLNALVGRDRAIVSDTPGTTRDQIESEVEIDGVRFCFTDTAGLREAADKIEAEGVRRTHHSVGIADVVLYVYDVHVGLADEEEAWIENQRALHEGMRVLVVGNKADLLGTASSPASSAPADICLSAVQAREDERVLSPLLDWLRETVVDEISSYDASAVVTNERHQGHLAKAQDAVRAAQHGLSRSVSGDVLAIDLRTALHELGAITGEITNEDVLDQIFSRFCIGK